jgi:ABC-type phosphate transport system ATPase subunit
MSSHVQAQASEKAPAAETNKVVVRNLNFYYGQAHALKDVSSISTRVR